MYERIAFIKSSHVLGSCDKSRIFLIPKRREGGWGWVSVVKIIFFGKTRFKSYLTINQSQKLKLIFFHIFLTASGEGGGSTQVVSLTAFSQFFFLTASLSKFSIICVATCFCVFWRSPFERVEEERLVDILGLMKVGTVKFIKDYRNERYFILSTIMCFDMNPFKFN